MEFGIRDHIDSFVWRVVFVVWWMFLCSTLNRSLALFPHKIADPSSQWPSRTFDQFLLFWSRQWYGVFSIIVSPVVEFIYSIHWECRKDRKEATARHHRSNWWIVSSKASSSTSFFTSYILNPHQQVYLFSWPQFSLFNCWFLVSKVRLMMNCCRFVVVVLASWIRYCFDTQW